MQECAKTGMRRGVYGKSAQVLFLKRRTRRVVEDGGITIKIRRG
jgi:hypothetical protein